jgi:4-amino-4-deoxy-L-arabinose transferase-like glycosyltransferase
VSAVRVAAPAPPTGRRVPRRAWLAVLALALVLRLAVVAVSPPRIFMPDGIAYEAIGRALHEGRGYGLQTQRPPGYPTLVAGVYSLLGPDLTRLRLVEAVLGTATVGVVGAAGAALFGGPAGLVAAALAAIHPVMTLLPATQYSENLLLLLVTLAFAAAFAAWRRGGLWRWALTGLAYGLALLVRPNLVTMVPGLVLGLALALRHQGRPWLAPVLLTGLAAALTVAPWVVRCHRVHDRWFFVSTGGGASFWLGNNAAMTGASDQLVTYPPELMRELTALPSPASRESLFYERGKDFVRGNPGRAARLYLAKLGNLFALHPETATRSSFMNAGARIGQGVVSALLFLGALLALRRWRSTPALWPMVGAIATFALVSAAYFTVFRYRLPFEPLLLWMAGLGWAGVLARPAPAGQAPGEPR